MPERPKVYHGHYVVVKPDGTMHVHAVVTMKHPLSIPRRADQVIANWLPISGLKEDWDRWGYKWDEGIAHE